MKPFRKATFEESLGTGFQGTIPAHYDLLVECFGEPELDRSEKTPAWWGVAFEDGTVATIYCWKTYGIPDGPWTWNIGGFDIQAVQQVREVVNAKLSEEVAGKLYYYIAERGNYQILGREDNELVYFDFDLIGATDLDAVSKPVFAK